MPEESILVESVEAVQWPDSSLGCPQPGMLYAQVVTPGYLIVLAVEDQTYEYHADLDRLVVLVRTCPCPNQKRQATAGCPSLSRWSRLPCRPTCPRGCRRKTPTPPASTSFDPGDRSLLVAPAIQVLPTTEVLVGLSGATVPGRPYVAS